MMMKNPLLLKGFGS